LAEEEENFSGVPDERLRGPKDQVEETGLIEINLKREEAWPPIERERA